MTPEELRQHLRLRGWTLALRARRKTGKLYAYASQRRGQKVVHRYICPEDQIPTLTEESVDRRLV